MPSKVHYAVPPASGKAISGQDSKSSRSRALHPSATSVGGAATASLQPSSGPALCATSEMADVHPPPASVNEPVSDKVRLPSVCIIYDEEKSDWLVPRPERLPPDVTDSNNETERTCALVVPDEGECRQPSEGFYDKPILCHEVTVHSLQSDITTIKRITQLYCELGKRPKVISQTNPGFEHRMPTEDLRVGTRRYNGFIPVEEISKSLIAETNGFECNSATTNESALQSPNRVVNEKPQVEDEEPARNPANDHVWIKDFITQVARRGKSSLPWKEIQSKVIEYIKEELGELINRYQALSKNKKSRNKKAECSRIAKFVYAKMEKFDDFPVTFQKLCEILSNPPRCGSKISTFVNALKKVVDVDETASIYSPPKSKLRAVKKKRGSSHEESKIGSPPVSEAKHGTDSATDPDSNSEDSTHKRGSKKRRNDKHKRQCQGDISPECVPEHLMQKKSKLGKKAMSDLSNYE